MTVSKIRLNGTDHDIRAKYLIQSSSSDATSAEFSARTVTEDAIANILSIYGNTVVVSDTLTSNSATAILSRGTNQWDEQWRNGYYGETTGVYADAAYVCTKNPIPITGGNQYYLRMGESARIYISYYNSQGSLINTTTWKVVYSGNTFTPPPDATSMNFWVVGTYGGSYKNDICINISNPAKNGTYEPYNGHQIDLGIPTLTGKLNGAGSSVVIFPNGMQSNGTTRDELTATSAIKRMADDNSVLSSPQTYILDNALQLQYPVVAGGTEMVLPTTGTAPMKMDVIYGNAADAAATMSQNFISVDSMKNFLSALGTQMNGTWAMQYSGGKYTFTFTSN